MEFDTLQTDYKRIIEMSSIYAIVGPFAAQNCTILLYACGLRIYENYSAGLLYIVLSY
jgi:hypothetical protein